MLIKIIVLMKKYWKSRSSLEEPLLGIGDEREGGLIKMIKIYHSVFLRFQAQNDAKRARGCEMKR